MFAPNMLDKADTTHTCLSRSKHAGLGVYFTSHDQILHPTPLPSQIQPSCTSLLLRQCPCSYQSFLRGDSQTRQVHVHQSTSRKQCPAQYPLQLVRAV